TFLLFSAACSSSSTGGGIAPLIDVEWRVVGLTGVDGVEPDLPNEASVTFRSDDPITGNAGCNNFFGDLDIGDDRVDIGPIGITEMACVDRADWFGLFEVLSGELMVVVEGSTATLTSARGGTITIEYVEPDPPREASGDPDQPVSTANGG
ncbi:MAG: META domain-containing protein, partial [Acidimicrobiales bacterium]|nr:META domain-containing protein [Acidimicrobiales bacterium]